MQTTVNGVVTFSVTITGALYQPETVAIAESAGLFGGSFVETGDSWAGGPCSSETLTSQATGQTPGTETITATDNTNSSYQASITADVVQVQSITVADGAGTGQPITETGMSSDTLYYTRNTDGTASINLSSVVVPATSAGYAATQYELIDPSGNVVQSGQLAAQMNISIPAPANGTADGFTLEAGTNINGTFSATQSILLAARVVTLQYSNPGGVGSSPFNRLKIKRPDGQIVKQGVVAKDQSGATVPVAFSALTSTGGATAGITVTSGGPNSDGVVNPTVTVAPGVAAGDYNVVVTSPEAPGISLTLFIIIP